MQKYYSKRKRWRWFNNHCCKDNRSVYFKFKTTLSCHCIFSDRL